MMPTFSHSLEAPRPNLNLRRGSAPPAPPPQCQLTPATPMQANAPIHLASPTAPHDARKNSSPDVGGSSSDRGSSSAFAGLFSGLGRKSKHHQQQQQQQQHAIQVQQQQQPTGDYPVHENSSHIGPLEEAEDLHDDEYQQQQQQQRGLHTRSWAQEMADGGLDDPNSDLSPPPDCPHGLMGGLGGIGGGAVSLDMDSLKDLLRCVACRRFLFPPIQQCLSGHMTCRACFQVRRCTVKSVNDIGALSLHEYSCTAYG